MLRAQVQFTEDEHRRLRVFADGRGISIAAAVRRAVDSMLSSEEAPLGEDEQVRALLALAGRYRDCDGRTDVAMNHDRFLFDENDGPSAP